MTNSPTEDLLKKADRLDKSVRIVEVIILGLVAVFTIFTLARLQQIIDQNQASTLNARKANIARQDELKDYIKCVLLIRYDVPQEQLTTREGAEKVLDDCATRGSVGTRPKL